MSAAFDRARAIADALLLEGYVLYPYRASSKKNQFRFAFGVLAPRAWSEAGGCEAWWMETQCLALGDAPRIEGVLRFLRVVRRTVEEAHDGEYRAVSALDAGQLRIPWDEGEVCEIPFGPFELGAAELGAAELGAAELARSFVLEPAREEEPAPDAHGALVGRVVRARSRVEGVVRVRAERIEQVWRISVRVENLGEHAPGASRDAVLPASCVSTHLMLAIDRGSFASLLDPPEHAREAASACASVRCHPVLAGPEGTRDLVLASPIILYDHPQIAPESPGDFFDASEIDELLALRTATLTEDEKREVRATDPRAAAIVDRVEALPPEAMARLHGAIRDRDDAPAHPYRPGGRVRLKPGCRRTDAQDLLYVGCVATIEAVMKDVDGRDYLAVTIDDDPAAELHRWYGRFHSYYPDEVEPLEGSR